MPQSDMKEDLSSTEGEDSFSSSPGKVVRHAVVSQAMSGPLPPPAMLREYDEALPGSAERILAMAEREQVHRHDTLFKAVELEDRQLTAGIRESLIGQVAAFTIAITAIIGGIILIALDKSAGGVSTIIGSLVALVTTFLVNRLIQSRSTSESPQIAESMQDDEGVASAT